MKLKNHRSRFGALGLAISFGLFFATVAVADDGSFEPVWRMLTREQKEQFVAGYLSGMRDAARMADLLQDFVKQNPQAGSGSLDRLQQIYGDLGRSRHDAIVSNVDSFYADPANHGAQLSAAISAGSQSGGSAAATEVR